MQLSHVRLQQPLNTHIASKRPFFTHPPSPHSYPKFTLEFIFQHNFRRFHTHAFKFINLRNSARFTPHSQAQSNILRPLIYVFCFICFHFNNNFRVTTALCRHSWLCPVAQFICMLTCLKANLPLVYILHCCFIKTCLRLCLNVFFNLHNMYAFIYAKRSSKFFVKYF